MGKTSPALTAADVRVALRRRHPAYEPGILGVGRWVTLTEWQNIDLLALDAWRSGEVVGYEVKVSRSDMHSELLDPSKRAAAVAMCTRFYIATPAGLLTPEERAWEEPEWGPDDFKRAPCSNPECRAGAMRRGWAKKLPTPRGRTLKGTEREGVSISLGSVVDSGVDPRGGTYRHHIELRGCCTICRGYGYEAKSRAESLAPYLWVPRDVGLVSVGPRGCSVLKEAPRRQITEPIIPWPFLGYRREDGPPRRRNISEADLSRIERQQLAIFARWVSARPDPRHAARRRLQLDCDVPSLERDGVELG